MAKVISEKLMNDLAKKMNEYREEGRDSIDCHHFTKEELRNNHDGEIWQYVDANPGETFDGVLEELVDSIEELADAL